MKIVLAILLISFSLFGKEIRVASYNVENLFDLKYDGSEYKDYIPNTGAKWNKKTYLAKLRNISKVISAFHPDIIGLQEIESENALLDLRAMLKSSSFKMNYKYYAIALDKKKSSAVTTALLSKYPIEYRSEVKVTNHHLVRNVLEVGIKVGDEVLTVFVNHWKSKSGGESKRVRTAEYLMKRLSQLDDEAPYILLGDFNSNYNEFETFIKSKYHNDTDGKTGINHTLGTIKITDWKLTQFFKNILGISLDSEYVTKDILEDSDDNENHYNLWLELPDDEKWSYKNGRKLGTLDNIIISKGLIDSEGIDYKDNSYSVFKGVGTVNKKGKIARWKRGKNKVHLGKGFSDHLPIYADFSVKK